MIKRLMDIVLSGIALIVLFPLLPPIVLLLKLTGEGEIFYIQPRTGKGAKPFGLVKFATMLKNSPNLPGGDVTLANDPRVLPMGRFLRKTKINELPQLWNILKGDMSFVGPRPLIPNSFARYPVEIQNEIKTLQPGLTGIGSIVFRDEECITSRIGKPKLDCYYEDMLPYKGQLEVWYKHNQTLWLDILLLFFTAWAILFPSSRVYEKVFKSLPEWPSDLLVKTEVGHLEA